MKPAPEVSTLSLAVLGLISQQPLSGYDLRKVFSTTPMGHFSRSPGAIYPALRRMEASGWVKGSIDRKRKLRPRQLYSLTEKGRLVLARTLKRPVTRDDIIWHMDDLMLRAAFTGSVLGREKAIAFMKELASEAEAYVASLRKHLAGISQPQMIYGRLALEQGLGSYAATASWARRAARELEKTRGT